MATPNEARQAPPLRPIVAGALLRGTQRMTFWQGLKSTYAGSIAFLSACPLLALVPVAFELVQHVVEARIGLYDSLVAAKALEHDPWRMGFGFLKVVALLVPSYWIIRFLAYGSPVFARRIEEPAVRLFAGFLAFQVALVAIQLFVLPPTAPMLALAFLGGQVIGCLVAPWGVAAALGNATVGLRRSVTIMLRQTPWTFAFLFVAMLPLMIPHYLFGALAILGPRSLLWPVLAADSLLVGWLTAVLAASSFVAGTRAAAKTGITLVPGPVGRLA